MSEATDSLQRSSLAVSSPDSTCNCFAAVPRGAEEIAAAELRELGISGAQTGRGGVAFAADRAGLYKANLWLRTASRVLVQLAVFPCTNPAELYGGVHAVDWTKLITPAMTLAVDCSLRDSALTHSGFVALKTKDAIVDRIREACGSRPNVDTASPDVRINVHLHRNVCTISLTAPGTRWTVAVTDWSATRPRCAKHWRQRWWP